MRLFTYLAEYLSDNETFRKHVVEEIHGTHPATHFLYKSCGFRDSQTEFTLYEVAFTPGLLNITKEYQTKQKTTDSVI
jgi:hypothetical protein